MLGGTFEEGDTTAILGIGTDILVILQVVIVDRRSKGG